MRVGASERVDILTQSNELVINSFMLYGIYPYQRSDLFIFSHWFESRCVCVFVCIGEGGL